MRVPPEPTGAVALDRRRFLTKVVSGAVVVAALPALPPGAGFTSLASAQASRDASLAAFAESVELVAVAAYETGIELLSDDLAPVLQTLSGHHAEHADAWAEVAGDLATGQANPLLLEALTPVIEGFGSQNEVLRFARDLENQLSVTWGHLLTILEDVDAGSVAATILPVEAAHAAALTYELSEGLAAAFPFGAAESTELAFGLDPAAFPVTPQ